jgi:hypothetical protein
MKSDKGIELTWFYRVINNPAARKKWLIYGACFIGFALLAGAYRYAVTGNLGRTLIITSMFILVILLYIQIVLGKVRQYYIDDKIRYRPFRTDLRNLKGFEVDEDAMKISLNLKKSSILAVKTLYFEDESDLKDVERFLSRIVDKPDKL